MIVWDEIREGLCNAFRELTYKGLENVKVLEATTSYVLIEIMGLRESLVFLDCFDLNLRKGGVCWQLGKFPLAYECLNEFDGKVVPFPIVSGSTSDFYERTKETLEKGMYFCFFYSSREESTEKKYRPEILKSLKEDRGLDEKNIVSIPITNQVIGEDLGELFSILFFRNLGFLATNKKDWLSWVGRNGYGAPDVLCWRTLLVEKLVEMGLLPKGGTLAELAFARVLGRVKGKLASFTNRTAVIEVESSYPNSSNSKAASQLLRGRHGSDGYLRNGFFDEGYAMTPFDINQRPDVGVLSFDKYRIQFFQCPQRFSDNRKDCFIRQTDEVIKQTLMMNFTLDEIFGMVGKPNSVYELLKRIHELDTNKVIGAIEY